MAPLRCLVLTCLVLLGASCARKGPSVSTSFGGMESTADGLSVSGGGFRLVPDAPVLFFGTVLENGERRYAYLVVGRELEVREVHEDSSSGLVSIVEGAVQAEHRLRIDGVTLAARFTARLDPATRRLQEAELSLQGRVRDPGEGALYLFDWRDANATPLPVPLELPALPEDLDAVQAFTEQLVGDLLDTNETVRAFVDG